MRFLLFIHFFFFLNFNSIQKNWRIRLRTQNCKSNIDLVLSNGCNVILTRLNCIPRRVPINLEKNYTKYSKTESYETWFFLFYQWQAEISKNIFWILYLVKLIRELRSLSSLKISALYLYFVFKSVADTIALNFLNYLRAITADRKYIS